MNNNNLLFLILAASGFTTLSPQALPGQATIFPVPLSPRIANYEIAVTLDPANKTLEGNQVLVWKNTSRQRIYELQFHLYLNGFKDSESTFMKEAPGRIHAAAGDPDARGWIVVDSMRVRNGEDLTGKIEFIHPHDGNRDDQTVIRVPLRRGVGPGRTIVLDIKFSAKLPKTIARTGYAGNFFLVAQWFPKIGVYEPAGMRYAAKGEWNCHQFHYNTEFYADFGVYDVRMTVPDNFILGATGILRSETKDSDGTTTHHYHAEDVHDFAWTASPLYKVIEEKWEHVSIRLLMQPDHVESKAARYLHCAKATLEYFDKWMGKYPYPNLTIVDPQYGAIGASGMEYPTFIVGQTYWGLPEGIREAEFVCQHEFGHQYFYGMLASNEFEEAWLDEGFTQYAEGRIMDDVYGKKTSFYNILGYMRGDFEEARSGYIEMNNPKLAPSSLKGWEYTAGGYGGFTYYKPAVWLTTLERLLGREVMDEIMRTYFERWKFKHPCGRDFIAIVNEIVPKRYGGKFGAGMNWYFDQVLYGTDICDYELTSIKSVWVKSEEDSTKKRTPVFQSTILVSRLGEIKLPVEVLVHFEDSTNEKVEWDGKERFKQFTFTKKSRAVRGQIDPDFKIPLDVNIINNSKMLEPERTAIWKYTAKFFFWIQNALQTATIF